MNSLYKKSASDMNELCQKVAKHMQMEELVKLRHQTWVEQVGERKNANKEGKKRN